MKYRKKPVVIDAIKFTRENTEEVFLFTEGAAHNFKTAFNHNIKSTCEIRTLEGDMIALEGDYIIRGVNDEYYPCKPDIFEKTYEVVKE